MRKLWKNNNADGMTTIFYIVFFIMIISVAYFLLGGLSSDNVKVYENGTLETFSTEPSTRLIIQVDNISYYNSFNTVYKFDDYVQWLFDNLDSEVSFYTYEDGIVNDDGHQYFYDLHVHAFKNVTVKQVLYEEDGWGWWDKPPVRVVFNDGSNFVFKGDSDYKFDMYSMFIAYNGEQVHIDYKFDEDETIILSIERAGCPACERNE